MTLRGLLCGGRGHSTNALLLDDIEQSTGQDRAWTKLWAAGVLEVKPHYFEEPCKLNLLWVRNPEAPDSTLPGSGWVVSGASGVGASKGRAGREGAHFQVAMRAPCKLNLRVEVEIPEGRGEIDGSIPPRPSGVCWRCLTSSSSPMADRGPPHMPSPDASWIQSGRDFLMELVKSHCGHWLKDNDC